MDEIMTYIINHTPDLSRNHKYHLSYTTHMLESQKKHIAFNSVK